MVRLFPSSVMFTVLALALSACSGGGGGGGNPTLSPTPTPTPPPNYDTTEYRANYGLDSINAIAAYDEGLSGQGITVAVIDTGVDLDHPDLDANISPQSIGMATGSYAGANDLDAEGHGTVVAGIIIAEKNNSGTHGVAFNATLLAVNASDASDCPGECAFYQSDLADGITYAKNHGAKVINLSMGGMVPGITLENAMRSAVEAGVIIVISAGNDGAAAPSDFAQIANAPWAQGRIIIAGAVDANNVIADFSDRAGDASKSVYVVAPGVSVRSTGIGGTQVIASGTSFSAPHVVGALALLAEMFPNLTAAELTEILFTTAHDLGDPGVDAVYGWGVIDLAAAIQPIGPAGIPTGGGIVPAATDTPAAIATALSLSPPFGDALSANAAFSQAMALDAYRRSYRLDLNRLTTWSATAGELYGLVSGRQFGLARRETVAPGLTLSYAARRDAEINRVIDAGSAETPAALARVGIERRFAGGGRYSFALNDPGLAIGGSPLDGVFLRRASVALGMLEDKSLTAHIEEPMGRIRLGFTSSLALTPDVNGPLAASSTRLMMVTADTAVAGNLFLRLGFGLMKEDGAVLGSRSAGALSLGGGATTRLLDLQLNWPLQNGPQLFAHGTFGGTKVSSAGASLLQPDSAIITLSAELGALWGNALSPGDSLGLMVALPPRVESGQLLVGQVTGRDYAANSLSFTQTALPLSPSGREIDLEAAYALPLRDDMTLRANARYAMAPGHRAEAADAVSLLISLSHRF